MNHFREESNYNISHDEVSSTSISFLAHSSDIDDLLEGLDGVLEDWLDGLHDTESSLHIVNLWLHAFDEASVPALDDQPAGLYIPLRDDLANAIIATCKGPEYFFDLHRCPVVWRIEWC
jgi:hypothetical protein